MEALLIAGRNWERLKFKKGGIAMGNLPMLSMTRALSIQYNRELPKYFTKEEMDRILEVAREKPKQFLLVNFLWITGARISEALAVKVKDIDFTNKLVRVTTLKRRNVSQRVMHLKENLVDLLKMWISNNKLSLNNYVFGITRFRAFQIIQQIILKAGFDKERAHPHTLRHSFAVNLILQGVSPLVVNEYLGHADLKATMIYMKVLAKDTRNIFDAVQF
jgi:site-specific recombinase XerD